MCGPGASGDVPWLYIDVMLSSQFSLAGECVCCKGWEGNGLKTGAIPCPGSHKGIGNVVPRLAMTMGRRRNVWRD